MVVSRECGKFSATWGYFLYVEKCLGSDLMSIICNSDVRVYECSYGYLGRHRYNVSYNAVFAIEGCLLSRVVLYAVI